MQLRPRSLGRNILSIALLAITPLVVRADDSSDAKSNAPVTHTVAALKELSPAELNTRLQIAVSVSGQLGHIRALLAAGADPLARPPGYNLPPPLLAAIHAKHADYAEAILDARPGICDRPWRTDNESITMGMAALYYSIENNQNALALRLLKTEQVKPTPWRPVSGANSVLQIAVDFWNEDLVRALINAGADFGAGEGFFTLLERYATERKTEMFFKESEKKHAQWQAKIDAESIARMRAALQQATDPEQRARMEKMIKRREEWSRTTPEVTQRPEPTTLGNIRMLAAMHAPGESTAPGLNDRNLDYRTPLSTAVERGWPEVASILIKAGADPHMGLIKQKSIFEHAASDPAMMRALAGQDPDSLETDQVDGPAYAAAIHRGDKALLESTPITPALLAFRDPVGKSVLHHAIQVGDDSLARRLIAAGAEIDTANNSGQTPLFYAAFKGRNEIMRLLLDRHARADGPVNPNHSSPLIAAAAVGNAEGVRLLLAAGANTSVRNDHGMSVLIAAAMHSPDPETVRLLVEAGARLDVSVDINGYAMGPLEATFEKDRVDILVYLLGRGAPWSYARHGDDTPLLAATRNKAWQCARLLLSRGERDDRALALAEDPAFKSELEDVMQASGSTALDDAELWPAICEDVANWRARVDAHLAKGGNVNYRALNWTPLLLTIKTGRLEFVRHLLAKGADPKVHPMERFEGDPGTLDYIWRFQPRDMSIADWDIYRAALIRLIVPLEPRRGLSDYEWNLSNAACLKSWLEVEAYVAAGVDTGQAIAAVRKTLALTEEERARALKLLGAEK